ncbi:MAG TPA: peptidase MA family metallohydrolase [Acidobacteriota bacterium]|nr:peptidase MA family metallohydrolase [Acidobacteriota bacterium]
MTFLRIFVLLLVYPSLAAFADVIHLKNGRQIECEAAWEDGKEVRYKVGTGTVGIPRAMVAKIIKNEPKQIAQTQSTNGTPSSINPQTSAALEKESIDTLDPKTKAVLARSYSEIAKTQLEKKDLTGALENLKKAYSLQKDAERTQQLAVVYFMLKDDWNAELLFRELLKLDPKNTEALNYLGEIAWRKENLDEALDFWQKSVAIKSDPVIQEKLNSLKRERKASSTYENEESRHFIMRYDGGKADPFLVDEISDFLEESYQKLSMQLEAYPTTPFVVILYPQERFQTITEAPEWSAGINDGKIKLPVRGIKSLNEEMRGVLIHELTHSFVNYKTSGNCPVWLHEGLAQRMEGKQISNEAARLMGVFASEGKLPEIVRLNGSFVGASSDIAQFLYVQSLSFTQFLIDRYRFIQMNVLLDELGNGRNLDDAFLTAYFVPLSRIEAEWRQSLKED